MAWLTDSLARFQSFVFPRPDLPTSVQGRTLSDASSSVHARSPKASATHGHDSELSLDFRLALDDWSIGPEQHESSKRTIKPSAPSLAPAQLQRAAFDAAAHAEILGASVQKYAYDATNHPLAVRNPFWPAYHSHGPEFARVRYIVPQDSSGKIYRRGPLLARGGFNKVYDVLDEQGQHFILRLLHLTPQRDAETKKVRMATAYLPDVYTELTALALTQSPLRPLHIFHYASGEGPDKSYKLGWILRPYASDLQRLTDGGATPPSAAVMRHVTRTLLHQVAVLHDQNIVHRDIKPENLFYDRGGVVTLADFGLSAPVGSADGFAGTPGFMAPEYYGLKSDEAAFDGRVDSFSLGLALSAIAFPQVFRAFPLGLRAGVADTAAREHIVRAAWAHKQALADDAAAKALNQSPYASLFFDFEALYFAWADLDAGLLELVAGSMLDPDPTTRASVQDLAAKLSRMDAQGRGTMGQAEADKRAAAAYFDAKLDARGESARTLPVKKLNNVPPVPAHWSVSVATGPNGANKS